MIPPAVDRLLPRPPLQDWNPCPFCGSRHLRIITAPLSTQLPSAVSCRGCGAVGPRQDTAAQAIDAWNVRLTPHRVVRG